MLFTTTLFFIVLLFIYQCKSRKESKYYLYVEEFNLFEVAMISLNEELTKRKLKDIKKQMLEILESYFKSSNYTFIIFSPLILKSNKKVIIKKELIDYLESKYDKNDIFYLVHKQNFINKHIYYFLVKCFGMKKYKTPIRNYVGIVLIRNGSKKNRSFNTLKLIFNNKFARDLMETTISILIILFIIILFLVILYSIKI